MGLKSALKDSLLKSNGSINCVPVSSIMLRSPLKADLYINYQCNSNCIHCYTLSSPREKTEMSLVTAKLAIDQMVNANVFYSVILGGEPLLHPHLLEILDYAISQNIIIGISTNGTLIDQDTAKNLSERCEEIQVSLHASNQESYLKIFGVDNFHKAIRGIRNLLNEGIRVSLNCTIMSVNLNEVPAIVHLAENLGIHDFIVNPFLPAGRGKVNKYLMLNDQQLIELESNLMKLKSQNDYKIDIHNSAVCPDASLNQTNKWLELFYGNCQGRQMVAIDPLGNITACSLPIREEKAFIGNIHNHSIQYYWDNADMFKWFYSFKHNLKGRCKQCELEFCSGCRALALIENGDFFSEDPYCPNIKALSYKK